MATLTMVYKLMESASKKWRRLNGYDKLPDVADEVQYINGIRHNLTTTKAPQTTVAV